jgi:hypothetical protein
MNARILTVFFAVMLPGLSFGQGSENYQCTLGDLQRRIEIFHETGVSVPCEVHYYKDTEAPGEMQVLWRAVNQSGYCEMKTQEFIGKLTELGWSCSQGVESAPESEQDPVSEPDDDTDELTPAEDAESNADQ